MAGMLLFKVTEVKSLVEDSMLALVMAGMLLFNVMEVKSLVSAMAVGLLEDFLLVEDSKILEA